jgi:ABC-2 type transport system permease protein
MGIWSATSTSAARRCSASAGTGTLELLVASPTHFALVLLPRTIALATIGIYSMVAHRCSGAARVRRRPDDRAPAAVRALDPGHGDLDRRCSASCSRSLRPVPHRLGAREHARVPVWLICGFLVPLSLFPDWVRPISWVLAPTWGMNAIRESALGGSPLPICSCASARRRYTRSAWRSSTALLAAARARARCR